MMYGINFNPAAIPMGTVASLQQPTPPSNVLNGLVVDPSTPGSAGSTQMDPVTIAMIASAVMGGISSAQAAGAGQELSEAQLAQQALLGILGQQQQANMGLVGAAPTGWAQQYQQQNLLQQMLLNNITGQPSLLTPSNPQLASQLPQQAQFSIPEEWAALNPYGVDQTMASIANRQGVLNQLTGGQGPQINFSQFGLTPEQAQQYQQQVEAQRRNATHAQNTLYSALGFNRGSGLAPTFNGPSGLISPNPALSHPGVGGGSGGGGGVGGGGMNPSSFQSTPGMVTGTAEIGMNPVMQGIQLGGQVGRRRRTPQTGFGGGYR